MQVTAGEKLLVIPGVGFGIQAPKAHGPRVYLLQKEVSVSSPKGSIINSRIWIQKDF